MRESDEHQKGAGAGPGNESQDERRAYARVATRIRARLRPLATPEEAHRFTPMATPDSDEARAALKRSSLNEGVVAFLLDLSAKVDTLLSLALHEQLAADFPLEAEVTEISGAGVRLTVPEPLPEVNAGTADFTEGGHYEIVLFLDQAPQRLASAMGRISRAAQPDEPLGATELAMDFTRIRERDQNAVVAFVFAEERRQIRERHWE